MPLLPLQYMLEVMNDDTQPQARRDRMAIAAAPYVHARLGGEHFSKKEAARLAAQTAGDGTSWEGLLEMQPTPGTVAPKRLLSSS